MQVIPAEGVQPADWTAMERARLNFPPHGPPGNARLRLACQVRLSPCSSSSDGGEVLGGEEEGVEVLEAVAYTRPLLGST